VGEGGAGGVCHACLHQKVVWAKSVSGCQVFVGESKKVLGS
jgi:hypothetical protein